MSTNNPVPPIVPDDETRTDGASPEADVTKEVDGERVLDPDANDDLINSADADGLAAGDPERG